MTRAQGVTGVIVVAVLAGILPLKLAFGQGSAHGAGEILREIDDPQNGDRWLLVEDARHPGGPGLLLRAGEAVVEMKPAAPAADAPLPIIHAGERIVVEEHTAIVDARLEAVAMNPAWMESVLNVRLVVGGRVMRARATAPGRAVLEVSHGVPEKDKP